jgi:hypothetical protein
VARGASAPAADVPGADPVVAAGKLSALDVFGMMLFSIAVSGMVFGVLEANRAHVIMASRTFRVRALLYNMWLNVYGCECCRGGYHEPRHGAQIRLLLLSSPDDCALVL